jgi:hypothetical protein
MTNTAEEPPDVTTLVNQLALTASELAQHEDLAMSTGSIDVLYTLATAIDCLRHPIDELLGHTGDGFNPHQVDQCLAGAAAGIRRLTAGR